MGADEGTGERYASCELFSETNDNSVAVLLTYGAARVLLAGDAEAREEDMSSSPYPRP